MTQVTVIVLLREFFLIRKFLVFLQSGDKIFRDESFQVVYCKVPNYPLVYIKLFICTHYESVGVNRYITESKL